MKVLTYILIVVILVALSVSAWKGSNVDDWLTPRGKRRFR